MTLQAPVNAALANQMPRPPRYMSNCDWINDRESQKDSTNPSSLTAGVGGGKLLNHQQYNVHNVALLFNSYAVVMQFTKTNAK